jgi:hypothetical protein
MYRFVDAARLAASDDVEQAIAPIDEFTSYLPVRAHGVNSCA